jgi:CTP-dependent riboflavin kinase
MTLPGRFRISEVGTPRRTCGKFAAWMAENHETLRRYFNADLFSGSLNVDIDSTTGSLRQQLDRGEPLPAFTIPRRELRAMSAYLGDAQVWRVSLSAARIATPHECWVFRRIGSKVPTNVLEIVSTVGIVTTFGVRHGEDLELVFLTDVGKLE